MLSCVRAPPRKPAVTWEYENLIPTSDMDPDLREVEKGHNMWKVRSFRKWFRRTYRIDLKRLLIQYEPSNKPFWICTDRAIDLHDVIEIREGWKTDAWNQVAAKITKISNITGTAPPVVDENCCFSIIYRGSENDRRSLDLAAPDESVKKIWVRALHILIEKIQNLKFEDMYNRWLKQQFEEADVDGSGHLNMNEVLKLLNQLNISIDKKKVKQLFEEANVNKNAVKGEQVLDKDEFVDFYKMLTKRPELDQLFHEYSDSGGITVEGLLRFLRIEQGQTSATIDDASCLIDSYEPSNLKNKQVMTMDGFRQMLLNKSIFNEEHNTIYQDMSHPLSHYFIASSHNTYLSSHQLVGESSVENYIQALRQGCRCVELDCWDGPDGEPIVYHGYTATTKISFRDIISDAINVYAFKTSPLPLILSLEVHCSREQQETMASHLTAILGHKLYVKEVDPEMEALPSPDSLRQKILVKAKKHYPQGESETEDEDEDFLINEMNSRSSRRSMKRTSVKKKKVSMIRQLSDVVNLVQAVHFKGFETALSVCKCYQMSSFRESKALQLIENQGDHYKSYTSRHLARIYPDGNRTDSSNFNPIDFWNVGCQLVALNYQTEGKEMMINRARFRQNGNSGYVLKPTYLRPDSNESSRRQVLHITIVSGQFLPKPKGAQETDIIDPYVVVRIYGHSEDNTKRKTKSIHDNGFNPVWNETFNVSVRYPELAILTFIVKDYSKTGKNRSIANYAMPFVSIQSGYRHVFLEDIAGNPLAPASLFVKSVLSD